MSLSPCSRLAGLLLLCAVWLLSPTVQAQITADFATSTVSTDNLLSDNSGVYDAYSSLRATMKYYPLGSLEVNLSGEQTYYRETIGLSNFRGRLGLTFIPLKPESRLALYFSGSIDGRVYHKDFSGVDNNCGEFGAGAGYRLSPTLNLRSGVSFRSTAYINTDNDYKRDLDIFIGANTTLPGRNALDIEIGYGRTNYLYKDATLTGSAIPPLDPPPPNPIPYDIWRLDLIPDTKDNLWMLYISPRISRSLGAKTGVSLSWTQRLFQNYNGGFLWDISTGYLSPWATVWEGQNLTMNLKTYLIPKLIVTTGYGYWDKTFLVTTSQFDADGRARRYSDAKDEDVARKDFVHKVYLGVQWPLAFRSGFFIEPTINIEYTKNKSNTALYDYDNFSVTTGFSIRL